MLASLAAELVEAGPGRVVPEMPADPRFTQQSGHAHAGAATTLVDTACGYAAIAAMAADREVLIVGFLAPAAGARFRATATTLPATATALRAGRTIVVTRGEVHALDSTAGGRLVAAMQAAMMAVAPPPSTPDGPAA